MQNIYKNIKLLLLLTPLLGGIACKKIGVTHPTASEPQNRLTATYAAFARQYQAEGVNMSYYGPWCSLSMHGEGMPGAGAIAYGMSVYAGSAYTYTYRRIAEGRWEGGANERFFAEALVSIFRAQRMAEDLEKDYQERNVAVSKEIYFQAKSLRALAYYVRYLFFGSEALANKDFGGYKPTFNMELDHIIALLEEIVAEHTAWKADGIDIKFANSIHANILGVKGMLARKYALKELPNTVQGIVEPSAKKYAEEVIDEVKALKSKGVSFGAFDVIWGFDASEGASGYNRIWKDIAGEYTDFAWLRDGEDVYNTGYNKIYRKTTFDCKVQNGETLATSTCYVEESIPFSIILTDGTNLDVKNPDVLDELITEREDSFKSCKKAGGTDKDCYEKNQYAYQTDDLKQKDIAFYPNAKAELIIVRLQEMEDIIKGNFAKDRAFRNKSIFQGMINRAVAVRKMELGLDLNGVQVTFVPTNITF
jgi:hypothetical protein